MSQNTEQNVRTRDEQVQWMGRCIRASADHPSLEGFLREHIRIAEARGAAEEQRRQYAEGVIHIVFDGFPSPDGPKFVEVENPKGFSISVGEWRKRDDGLCELVILGQYEGLAVLGAKNDLLEARVKELEGVCRHVVWTEEEHGLGSRGHDSAVQASRAALTREGGV